MHALFISEETLQNFSLAAKVRDFGYNLLQIDLIEYSFLVSVRLSELAVKHLGCFFLAWKQQAHEVQMIFRNW